ncbi:uncharacterized protein V1513DRAFT_69602 [Lipomyces chichibuensis]|uniref:uncharacterized protein n=1 Tax=Lipomyces chichibuensis TaxID=1546026 RepID=UPI0033434EA6
MSVPSPTLAPTTGASVPEKPLAATSSGDLALSITLAEPLLFLQGFERSEYTERTPAMLRGTLQVHVAKPTKIKAINLTFTGRGRTEWPEGIPPAKDDYVEEKELISHLWPFFNAQFTPDLSFGADMVLDTRGGVYQSSALPPVMIRERERSSSLGRRSLSATGRRSSSRSRDSLDEKNEKIAAVNASSNKGYKIFPPGKYSYNFELPIDSSLPETIDCHLGSVKYDLEATIERPGAFKSKLVGKKEVTLIRTPAEASLEVGEPIVVSRNWEDQLHYDIVIGGKAFPIGSTVPVAFKLTPLAKVRCHRIRIMMTENTEYFCRNKKVHRIEPVRKFLLYEHQAASGANENLLGDLDDGTETAGPIEFEFNAKIPGCNTAARESQRLHPDTTYTNIKVHHWIKIVLRLSKADPIDSSKRRHFEVSIDSPFHLLSCRCTTANVSLPAYNRFDWSSSSALPPCPCVSSEAQPDQDVDRINLLARPRPMHLLRRPSLNPPPFDADVPPPPLVTPPPGYDDIVALDGGYFGSMNVSTHDDDEDDDEDSDRDVSLGFSRMSLSPNRSVASLSSHSSGSSSSVSA